MNVLKGKLTYVLSLLAVLGGIAGIVGGYTDQDTAIQMIWAGLAAFGIRRAIPQG